MRIKLRELKRDHWKDLKVIGNNEEIWEYLTTKPKDDKDFKDYVNKDLKLSNEGIVMPFVIEYIETEEIIGYTKLYNINKIHLTANSGSTWLHKQFWKKGINIEIKSLLLTKCFEELGYRRVQYIVDENNLTSQKSLTRMDAKFEGVFRNFRNYPSGLYNNSFIYSHILNNWHETKEHLNTLMSTNGSI